MDVRIWVSEDLADQLRADGIVERELTINKSAGHVLQLAVEYAGTGARDVVLVNGVWTTLEHVRAFARKISEWRQRGDISQVTADDAVIPDLGNVETITEVIYEHIVEFDGRTETTRMMRRQTVIDPKDSAL